MTKSRLEVQPGAPLPDIQGLEHVIAYLHNDFGYAKRGFNGLDPIEYTQVESWGRMENVGGAVRSLLVRLSGAYANQANISSNTGTPAPYSIDAIEDMAVIRDVAESKVRGMF